MQITHRRSLQAAVKQRERRGDSVQRNNVTLSMFTCLPNEAQFLHMTILSFLFCTTRRVSKPEWLFRVLLCDLPFSTQDQGSAEPGDGLVGLTGWLYLCHLLLNQLLCIDDLLWWGLLHVCRLWTLSCSRFWTFKMPRLSSGVDYSPVVNKSKPRTKLQQLEDACYLVIGTNKYGLTHLKISFSPQRYI